MEQCSFISYFFYDMLNEFTNPSLQSGRHFPELGYLHWSEGKSQRVSGKLFILYNDD